MQAIIAVVVGLVLSAPVVAEPLVEGWVRRSSGEPVEAAQVLVFDWTDLRRGAVAQTTTDAAGYFALPLASLGGSALPQAWTLGQNYPNPFNPSTIIPYQVPMAARVRLEVFNVLGQRVATLVDEERPAGVYTAVWDATDAAGRAVGAGVYFYRLRSARQPTLTRRMVLLDGQAGQVAAGAPLPQAQAIAPAAEGVYGLAVTGEGLVTYVDASFGVRSGMAPVEVVVDAVAGLPRGKALTDQVLGDVNGDGQVTLDDALLVTTYVVNGSVELPANGDIALGDVNGDGQVTLDDAQLLTAYVVDPSDLSLPEGIGQAVVSSSGDWTAGAIRNLTTNRTKDSDPSWSPDGRHIAFTSWPRFPGRTYIIDNIYVMGSDGSNSRNLSKHLGIDNSNPSWSPDGRQIAFVSRRDGGQEIYVKEGSGGTPLENDDSPETAIPVAVGDSIEGDLSAGDSDYFRVTVTSAGRLIASTSGSTDTYGFIEDSSGNVLHENDDGGEGRNFLVSAAVEPGTYYIRVRGYDVSSSGAYTLTIQMEESSNDGGGDWIAGAIRRLTDHPAEDHWPSWSPDGRHLAFMSDRDGNREIYVIGSDGSNPRNLTNHPAEDYSPAWSPDGRHIAFRSSDGDWEIYVMDSDGSNLRRLTDHSASDWSPSWSPDSRHLAFMSDRDGDWEIYVIGSDGSNPRRLTNDPDWDYAPSWSPDGRHIAFVSDRDGNSEIYVMGSDGSNPRNLTDHSAEDHWPSWSPDGRHIAFASRRDGNFEIYVMGSDGSNPRNLTDHPAWDFSPSWSPDGRHIAFASDRDGNGDIYVMELREVSSGGTPPDDDEIPETGIPLAIGDAIEIERELPAGGAWHFEVTVTSAGRLIASTTGTTDTYGFIEDSSGNVLHENDDGGEGRNFRVSAAVEPGTYYIRVRGYDGSSSGAFTLTIQMEEE